MTTKEMLHAKIETLDDQSIATVLEFVSQYVNSRAAERSGDLLKMLRKVQIDAPADFSENLDLYMNGERSVSDDVH